MPAGGATDDVREGGSVPVDRGDQAGSPGAPDTGKGGEEALCRHSTRFTVWELPGEVEGLSLLARCCSRGTVRVGTVADGKQAAATPEGGEKLPCSLRGRLPIFNKGGTSELFYSAMRAALEGIPFELILVDDGSGDGTPRCSPAGRCRRARQGHPPLPELRPPGGADAGLDHATGDAVVLIDADLQDPPELIPTMLDAWRAGSTSSTRSATSAPGSRGKAGHRALVLPGVRQLAQIDLCHTRATSACSTAARSTPSLPMRERNRFLRGMSVWIGFTQTAVHYKRDRSPRRQVEVHDPKDRPACRSTRSPRSRTCRSRSQPHSASSSPSPAFLAIPVAVGLKIAGEFVPGVATVPRSPFSSWAESS